MGPLRALLPVIAGILALVALALAVELGTPPGDAAGSDTPELVIEEGGEEELARTEPPKPCVAPLLAHSRLAPPPAARELHRPEPSIPPPRDRLDVQRDRMS